LTTVTKSARAAPVLNDCSCKNSRDMQE
jgi:hypothetical protein